MSSAITFSCTVNQKSLRRAERIAAESNTSVNERFNLELRRLVETYETAERPGNQNFKTLLRFSQKRITAKQAMTLLGMASDEELFLLMAQARLPMPRSSRNETRRMVDALRQLVK
jgi:hypothetical protein